MHPWETPDKLVRLEPRYRDEQNRLVQPIVYQNKEGVEYTMYEFVDEHGIGAM
ncbi:hypothetical protein [Stenotrophomonas phage BUCTxx99]|nr:hypothetical protein [Stenotrophomonas phage BUCTxx99]